MSSILDKLTENNTSLPYPSIYSHYHHNVFLDSFEKTEETTPVNNEEKAEKPFSFTSFSSFLRNKAPLYRNSSESVLEYFFRALSVLVTEWSLEGFYSSVNKISDSIYFSYDMFKHLNTLNDSLNSYKQKIKNIRQSEQTKEEKTTSIEKIIQDCVKTLRGYLEENTYYFPLQPNCMLKVDCVNNEIVLFSPYEKKSATIFCQEVKEDATVLVRQEELQMRLFKVAPGKLERNTLTDLLLELSLRYDGADIVNEEERQLTRELMLQSLVKRVSAREVSSSFFPKEFFKKSHFRQQTSQKTLAFTALYYEILLRAKGCGISLDRAIQYYKEIKFAYEKSELERLNTQIDNLSKINISKAENLLCSAKKLASRNTISEDELQNTTKLCSELKDTYINNLSKINISEAENLLRSAKKLASRNIISEDELQNTTKLCSEVQEKLMTNLNLVRNQDTTNLIPIKDFSSIKSQLFSPQDTDSFEEYQLPGSYHIYAKKFSLYFSSKQENNSPTPLVYCNINFNQYPDYFVVSGPPPYPVPKESYGLLLKNAQGSTVFLLRQESGALAHLSFDSTGASTLPKGSSAQFLLHSFYIQQKDYAKALSLLPKNLGYCDEKKLCLIDSLIGQYISSPIPEVSLYGLTLYSLRLQYSLSRKESPPSLEENFSHALTAYLNFTGNAANFSSKALLSSDLEKTLLKHILDKTTTDRANPNLYLQTSLVSERESLLLEERFRALEQEMACINCPIYIPEIPLLDPLNELFFEKQKNIKAGLAKDSLPLVFDIYHPISTYTLDKAFSSYKANTSGCPLLSIEIWADYSLKDYFFFLYKIAREGNRDAVTSLRNKIQSNKPFFAKEDVALLNLLERVICSSREFPSIEKIEEAYAETNKDSYIKLLASITKCYSLFRRVWTAASYALSCMISFISHFLPKTISLSLERFSFTVPLNVPESEAPSEKPPTFIKTTHKGLRIFSVFHDRVSALFYK